MAEVRKIKHIRHEIPENEGINMVPLMDIVFNLLIFFMVGSSMVKPNQIELDLPESTSGTKAADQTVLAVTYRLRDGRPEITLDDRQVASLDELNQAMRKIDSASAAHPPVDIRIEESVPYQDVVSVLDAVRDAGFFKFSLLTLAGETRGG